MVGEGCGELLIEAVLAVEGVGEDELEAVAIVAEAFAEELLHVAVDLDGDDPCAGVDEFCGEDAGAGADFEDGVGRLEVGGIDDTAEVVGIDEEVLAQGFFGEEASG